LYELNDDSTSLWSSYNRLYYHPRSVQEVNPMFLHQDVAHSFDTFVTGQQLLHENSQFLEESYDEKFRFFLEECDHLDVGCFFQ
jgi:hypothetical protein